MDKKILFFSLIFILFSGSIFAQNLSFLQDYENDSIYITLFEKNQELGLNLTNEELIEARNQIENNKKKMKFTIVLYLFILIVVIVLFIAFLKLITRNSSYKEDSIDEKIQKRKKKEGKKELDYSFLKFREEKQKNQKK